jgi:hypothetical protein
MTGVLHFDIFPFKGASSGFPSLYDPSGFGILFFRWTLD